MAFVLCLKQQESQYVLVIPYMQEDWEVHSCDCILIPYRALEYDERLHQKI
jgi:hypothetical protein